MLKATGAAVAVGAASAPITAMASQTECEQWQALIGQTFTIGATRVVRNRSAVRPKLKLVDVVEPEFDDPDRPQHFRRQFNLIFKPVRRATIEDGNYRLFHPACGNLTVSMNEIVSLEHSEQPVMQAVFG